MKDRGSERSGCAAGRQPLIYVLEVTHAAGSDHGHGHGVRDSARELDVVAFFGTIAVHAGEQNFSGAVRFHAHCPLDGVEAGWVAATVREYFPVIGWPRAPGTRLPAPGSLRVDGDHDA